MQATPIEVIDGQTNTANPTCTFTATPADGELIVLAVGNRFGSYVTPPAGFIRRMQQHTSLGRAEIFTKIASGESSAVYTITTTNNINSVAGYRFPVGCAPGNLGASQIFQLSGSYAATNASDFAYNVPLGSYVIVVAGSSQTYSARSVSNSYVVDHETTRTIHANRAYGAAEGSSAENTLITVTTAGSWFMGVCVLVVLGPSAPGTAAAVLVGSGDDKAWFNTSNILVADDTYAYCDGRNGEESRYLQASNFGFTVPPDASIDGVLVQIDRKADFNTGSSYVVDEGVKLMKASVVGGTSLHSATQWPTTEATASYGGATNLWGNELTSADVNLSTFGVSLRVSIFEPDMGTVQAQVDQIRMTVYYTEKGVFKSQHGISQAANRASFF